MKIFIDNVIEEGQDKGELFIESDSMNFMVNVYNGKMDKKGLLLYSNKGYFSDIKQAIRHVMRMKIHSSTATTLHELLREVESYQSYIESKIAI